MSFTRTRSGLKNFRRFFNADFTVYVEGRIETNVAIEDMSRPDSKFYSSLCSLYLDGMTIKIKLTGSKKNALDYHSKIIEQEIPNSLVIVDRDYDGLLYHRFVAPRLILTRGYSWENDFWTYNLILETLETATATANEAGITQILRRLSRGLARISCVNAAAHCNGQSFFESKGNSKGIRIDPYSKFPVSRSEFSRLVEKFMVHEFCESMANVYKSAKMLPAMNVTQGHLWEYAALLVISKLYNSITSTALKNNQILMNIALTAFARSPRDFLDEATISYYQDEFRRAV
ncbi:DUF4435 domain-containing protein [Pseudomonas tremae]|uniref:DUF4435 domain-containing protein n=1 Tax=Pseudomonas tremae TaxID=200454 RepID=UPI001F491412|nr:DUF4435 domain-containing protein [Pseudomonas tremae]MCF5802154.1 DUF4435 domain-containing protein [Pseudomonas tremae]MCF5811655.1 DUF4435 domain-containing protein [Pseudomonas tremae]